MHPRPLLAGLHSTIPAWSLIPNGLLRTQQNSRRHSRHLPRAADYEFHRIGIVRAATAAKAGLRDRGKGSRTRRRKGSRARTIRADREAVANRLRREGCGGGEE